VRKGGVINTFVSYNGCNGVGVGSASMCAMLCAIHYIVRHISKLENYANVVSKGESVMLCSTLLTLHNNKSIDIIEYCNTGVRLIER
jgi:hypothetical protein